MLDLLNIHKSKLRRDLLQLFFAHPEKKYYIRELERILNRPAAYIRRELMSFEDTGLFASEAMKKRKYFFLNKSYPLYKEVKAIISKTIGIEKLLKDLIDGVPEIEVAFMFGSYAKEEEDSLSDIDLMIIGNPDEDLLIEQVGKLERKIDREINYHIYSSEDIKQKKREKEPFVENVLFSKKIYLKGSSDELRRFNC